jgi:general secretion pathway protein H
MTRYQRGFTLIEILVVLLIVSVMSGIVIANLPGMAQSSDFDAEVKRLNVLLELAREEALMQSSEIGFRPDRDSFGDLTGYSFFIYDEINQRWDNFENGPLKARKLGDGIQLQLLIEGDANTFRLDEDDENVPPVMLLSSGETTPFDLVIYREPDLSATLRADGYSLIEPVEDER